ncbi:MAG: hypothetical protein CUN56_06065 [Phototrophicales bacterium]|nr:MAG: hypothetical protein CUN56_06065 [Phototrophicales bacterium]RMG71836.1 MAG: FHA domain-containing protein [Chloroflexota bacterium]
MGQGGFCQTHGPFDPPHEVCPYCVMEGLIAPPRQAHPTIQNPRVIHDDPTNLSIDEAKTRNPFESDRTAITPEQDMLQYGWLTFLIVQSPVKYRGRVFKVIPGQVVGRRNADVLINDRRVSRQHARINLEINPQTNQEQFAIFDFGTPNGTFVNQKRIIGREVIHENDVIQMGDHIFIFKTLRRRFT